MNSGGRGSDTHGTIRCDKFMHSTSPGILILTPKFDMIFHQRCSSAQNYVYDVINLANLYLLMIWISSHYRRHLFQYLISWIISFKRYLIPTLFIFFYAYCFAALQPALLQNSYQE